MTKQIVILGTGGTIAGQPENPADSVNYTAALVDISQLLDTAKGKQQDGATRTQDDNLFGHSVRRISYCFIHIYVEKITIRRIFSLLN